MASMACLALVSLWSSETLPSYGLGHRDQYGQRRSESLWCNINAKLDFEHLLVTR